MTDDEFKREIGRRLLPALRPLVDALNRIPPEMWDKITAATDALIERTIADVEAFVAAAVDGDTDDQQQ